MELCAGVMATIYAVVSPHSQIQIKTERLSPRTPTPNRPLRPVNSRDGEPAKARRQLAMNLNKGGPVINNRRNARERNRVKQVNQGFAVLRAHLPVAPKSKKISKVDTLRGAIDYIQALSELLTTSEEYDSPARYDSPYDSPARYDPAAGYVSPGFPCEPPPPPAPSGGELYPGSAFRPPGYGTATAATASAAAAAHPSPAEPSPLLAAPPSYIESVQQRGAPRPATEAGPEELLSALRWWHGAGVQHQQ